MPWYHQLREINIFRFTTGHILWKATLQVFWKEFTRPTIRFPMCLAQPRN